MDDTLVPSAADPETTGAGEGESILPEVQTPLRLLSPQVDTAELALTVEALLITSGRAVPSARLAVALGIAPTEDAAAQQSGRVRGGGAMDALASASAGDGDGASEPASEGRDVVVQPKPRKRKVKTAAGPSADELIAEAVSILNAQYAASHRSFRVEHVAGGYRFMTLPKFGKAIAVLQGAQSSGKLSRAAVESLAIIAYKQPVTKATLEAIRGVSCGEVLKSLLDKRLITVAGRSEELGRPILYATTRAFLEAFGLASLKDLPTAAELQARV